MFVQNLVAAVLFSSSLATAHTPNSEPQPTLKARFDNKVVMGNILAIPLRNGATKFKANLKVKSSDHLFKNCKEVNPDTGKEEIMLKWHIHVTAVAEDFLGKGGIGDQCGSAITGGHYDPTKAASADEYNCTPDIYEENQYACEVGDMSGKFGKVSIPVHKNKYKKYNDVFIDFHSADNQLIENRSLVFHCGAPR
eukprot:Pgem_evm1s7645